MAAEAPEVKHSDIIGWHEISWKGGSFPICFRPAGQFYCAKFQAPSRWELNDGKVSVDWGKFGKYEFELAKDKSMDGWNVPRNIEDPNNWRKTVFKCPISPEELTLLGDGAGTEWDFEWSGGSFPVIFKADGYNHFTCEDFPEHSHWTLEGGKLFINWGKYGNYDMTIDVEAKTMEGGAKGGDWKVDWRKGKHTRNRIDNKVIEACEHHH